MTLKKLHILNAVQRLLIIMTSFFVVLLTGCSTNDNSLANCDMLFDLTFEYTRHKEKVDMFPSEVKSLNIYVFDSKGKYVKCFSDERSHSTDTFYSLPVTLPEGTYTFVVWEGANSNYKISDKSGNYEQPLQPAVTDIDYSRLTLNMANTRSFSDSEDLFFGVARQVHINANTTPGTYVRKEIHIGLTRNTKKIHLTVNGIQNIKQRSTSLEYLEVSCNLANNELKFDNSISHPEQLFEYTPVEQTLNDDVFECNIRTLRLLTNMKSELIIKDPSTGEELFNDSLIDLLMLSPEINRDEDFDMIHEHEVVISINANQDISIIINGYTVIDHDLDLE